MSKAFSTDRQTRRQTRRQAGRKRKIANRPDNVACRWKVGVTFSSSDRVEPRSMQAPPIPLWRILWKISKDLGWRKR